MGGRQRGRGSSDTSYADPAIDLASQEPIVGPRLVALAEEAAKKLADTQAATAEFAAAHSRVVEPTVEGRAPTVFVDVGTRFMNLKEEAKRQKASQARQRLKAKKRSRQTA